MRFARRAAMCTGICAALLAGCKSSGSSPETTAATTQSSTAPAGDVKTFPVRGKVIRVDAAKGNIVLDHEAVPGFMDAMTMSYKLKDPSVASELHPGDRITAKIVVHKTADGYEDAVLDEIVVTAQAKPDYKPAMQYHVPQAGDAVPDFRLTNEMGRTIHLGQFKGRVLLLTFIYTRCPLADYCPRMNKNFAEIDKVLEADPRLDKETHLLSISFDPKYDTPAILKSYGGIYTAGTKEKFARWDFAAPPEKELPAMAEFFDLGVTPGEDGTLTHSLSTALIGKDGKVRAWYPTNEWTPAEVLAAMRSAAAA